MVPAAYSESILLPAAVPQGSLAHLPVAGSQLGDFLPQAQVLGLETSDQPILFETIADGAIYGIMNAPDQVCFCVAHGVVSKPIVGDNMAEQWALSIINQAPVRLGTHGEELFS